MKKIINGKKYDTDTFEVQFIVLLDGFYQHFDGNTFHYLREALYRTKKGTYFIYRRHDAENPCIDDFVSGMDVPILLFSREDAMLWAEIRLSAEEYFNAFGRPAEIFEF